MIAHSIESALKSNLFDKVYVSTDDNEIADISRAYGAIVPFLRPKNYSNDFATDRDVRRHFIEWLETNNIKANIMCYLYATAPFCTPDILESCYYKLINEQAKSVHTITTFPYPIMRALSKDKRGLLSFVWKENAQKRSQDFTEYYHDAGMCYFYDLNKYNDSMPSLGLQIPRFRCQDIDTLEDLENARKIYSTFFQSAIK